MRAGFDYGTSHCSIGVLSNDGVRLVPVEDDEVLIPSTLYAPRPTDQLDGDEIEFTSEVLDGMRFGRRALDEYLLDPLEGYFIKSPKSFLGAEGLTEPIKDRFIAVVAAMMANVKRSADRFTGDHVSQVAIGRPINFQGTGGEAENQQALTMLVAAAREAGFDDVTFLFEPMAAAMEYETRLREEELVLVLDIGGGTTDCSFVRVGPSRRDATQRDDDILGHAGERLGGNDYDQLLALAALMPHFGYGQHLDSGLPVPNPYFVDAVSTNDVNAQRRFYSDAMGERLEQCVKDGVADVRRLLRVQDERWTYRLMQSAEALKIDLSDRESACVDLGYVASGLEPSGGRGLFAESTDRLLVHLKGLVTEVETQAGRSPDVVYLTGGMARSAVVRDYLDAAFGHLTFADSDHFASVTQGLTVWANRVFA